jgi:dihydrofolate reductase
MSVDGYMAGPGQNLENPLGRGGPQLECIAARLLDEVHVAIVPVLLGAGERLFDHLDGGLSGYACVEHVSSGAVTHVRFAKE